MRTDVLLICVLLLSGCQAVPPPAKVVSPVATVQPVPAAPTVDPLIRQRRHIEALMAQNDALTARVRELEMPHEPVAPVPETVVAAEPVAPAPAVHRVPEPALLPNADGVLDLTVGPADDETNPFAVRTTGPEAVRELTLKLGGLVHGPVSCAIVNGRTVQAGDRIESLEVVRIETAAVLLRHGSDLLRLPLNDQPVRLRLPR
ncbi:MAG: hypothetical protein Q8M02_13260 [Candidatus Didemnitutus sp.]|nr:hypothetical protein [Candidatus Didemnitutus sp.]